MSAHWSHFSGVPETEAEQCKIRTSSLSEDEKQRRQTKARNQRLVYLQRWFWKLWTEHSPLAYDREFHVRPTASPQYPEYTYTHDDQGFQRHLKVSADKFPEVPLVGNSGAPRIRKRLAAEVLRFLAAPRQKGLRETLAKKVFWSTISIPGEIEGDVAEGLVKYLCRDLFRIDWENLLTESPTASTFLEKRDKAKTKLLHFLTKESVSVDDYADRGPFEYWVSYGTGINGTGVHSNLAVFGDPNRSEPPDYSKSPIVIEHKCVVKHIIDLCGNPDIYRFSSHKFIESRELDPDGACIRLDDYSVLSGVSIEEVLSASSLEDIHPFPPAGFICIPYM